VSLNLSTSTRALPWQRVQLDEPQQSPTRWLSPVERATVSCAIHDPEEVVAGRSILHEAAHRLLRFQERGVLHHMSGHYVADYLNYSFWPAPSKLARRGWVLLAALDTADLVRVTLSAEPLPTDPAQGFRRMRLSERLDELSLQRESVKLPA
jgi:hypothetical protein